MKTYREIEESKGDWAVNIVCYVLCIVAICLFLYALFSLAGLLLGLI